MGEDLPAVGQRQPVQLRRARVADHAVAGVFAVLAGRRHEIRLAQPGGLGLRRAVQRQLHAADAKAPLVAHRFARRAEPGRLHQGGRAGGENIGIGHHVGHQLALARGQLGDAHLVGRGAAILDGGVAVADVQLLAGIEHGHRLLGRQVREQARERGEEGVFLEHAVGFAAALAPADDPAIGRAAGRADAGGGQRGAVEYAHVARLVDGHHRQVARHRVQVIAVGVAAFLQLRVVVAEAQQHAELARQVGVAAELAQGVLQVGDAGVGPVRRRQQVGAQGLHADGADMAVGVDEAGQQRGAAQVVHAGVRAAIAQDGVLAAHRHDAAVPDRDGARRGRVRIDGDDGAAEPDGVGHGGAVGGRQLAGAAGQQRQRGGR